MPLRRRLLAPAAVVAMLAATPTSALQPPSYYIPFKSGSAKVPADSREHIEAAVAYVMDMSDERCRISLAVSGYADAQGSETENLALSQRRADSVARALVEAGLPPERVRTLAFGERQLAVTTADGEAEPLNRRAVIDTTGCEMQPRKVGD